MAQAVSLQPLAAEGRLRPLASSCEIRSRRSGNAEGFSQSISVLTWQYNSANAPYQSYIHLPPIISTLESSYGR
jgi:hypothetical protein